MAYIGRGLDNGVRNQFVFAATQGQTSFSGADSDGKTLAISDILYTDCFQNGVKLEPTTDYTVSLTTLTLVSAASLNDVVDIVSFDIFAVPDTVPASTGGTFGGGISATTGTFSGDVGIGTSPATILHIKESSPIFTQETGGNVTSGGVAYQQTKDVSGAAVFVQGFAGLANCYQFGTILANGFMRFLTGNQVEAMRITSDGRGLSQFTAKAWVNFNGTGTVAIRDSHNVSSITDNGTGNYTVNFTNNMANTNYSAVANSNGSSGWTVTDSHAVGSLRTLYYNSGGIDTSEINVQVFGD